jgi:hypothetical protein
MSKPFKDGTDRIRRDLLAKNIDNGLELEACGRNILAWEATDVKVLDILFESIPCLLVTNYQSFDDEA